jgi:hypothetical protein
MHYRLDSVKVAGDSRIELGLSPTPWWMWPAERDDADADDSGPSRDDCWCYALAFIGHGQSQHAIDDSYAFANRYGFVFADFDAHVDLENTNSNRADTDANPHYGETAYAYADVDIDPLGDEA